MRFFTNEVLAGGLLLAGASALPAQKPCGGKNFIFVVPDGHGPVHQSLTREYLAMIQSRGDRNATEIEELAVDELTIGKVRTRSASSPVTDSAAAGTAFSTGFRTRNGRIGVDENGNVIGNVLEAAKLAGFKTGLVVTSIINHATPAAFSAHSTDRNAYDDIAAQQIGYSHPLGSVVDVLLGGGRCYFKPMSDPTSCREDDISLFDFAEEEGWTVLQDKSAFDRLGNGKNASLPYIGLFADDHLMHEVDRRRYPDELPSLKALSEVALNSLEAATAKSDKGYFIMIEASLIDYGGHANDPVPVLSDAIEYNNIINYLKDYVDEHTDTVLMAAADHETGGLSLVDFNPAVLEAASASSWELAELFENYNGSDAAAYMSDTILPMYGLTDVNATVVDELVKSDDLASDLASIMSELAGVSWSTGGHTGVDTDLVAYAAGDLGDEIKSNWAGQRDNTELASFMAEMMGVKISDATEALTSRSNGTALKRHTL